MIFVTPASNIGDFSPFKAEPSASLDAAMARRVDRLRAAASQALDAEDPARAAERGDVEGALERFERALRVDPEHAGASANLQRARHLLDLR